MLPGNISTQINHVDAYILNIVWDGVMTLMIVFLFVLLQIFHLAFGGEMFINDNAWISQAWHVC